MNTVITWIGSRTNYTTRLTRGSTSDENTHFAFEKLTSLGWQTHKPGKKGIISRSSKQFEELKLPFKTWCHLTVRLLRRLCIKHRKRMQHSLNENDIKWVLHFPSSYKWSFQHSVSWFLHTYKTTSFFLSMSPLLLYQIDISWCLKGIRSVCAYTDTSKILGAFFRWSVNTKCSKTHCSIADNCQGCLKSHQDLQIMEEPQSHCRYLSHNSVPVVIEGKYS